MKKLLSAINLGDAYEVQARVFPAMLAVLPVTILILMWQGQHGHWVSAVGMGSGLEVVLAVAFSKLAHALGRNLETRMVRDTGGMPTLRWLLPDDRTHSEQQKKIWRDAVAKLADLNINAVLETGDGEELCRIIDDAVLNARNKIRHHAQAAMLRQANILYGFARNVAGLRGVIALLSYGSLAAALVGYSYQTVPLDTVLVEVLFSVLSTGFLWLAESYVRHCSERYAEFFFVACTTIASAKRRRGEDAGVKTH